eukprot:CAMPEP_0194032674 /NCGR_PEP_ID=MMETSP0009_2-20130614/5564_1 /TAXON_ID=210454 /ORGANISM="Grammatophora oceanica, Strain CCMP 410" /LENGTH=48 /DNA_ID= /DNA_START= /DNA_END= /DNA_ORIENTATION=
MSPDGSGQHERVTIVDQSAHLLIRSADQQKITEDAEPKSVLMACSKLL